MIKKFNINNQNVPKNLSASSGPDYGRIQRAAEVLPEGAAITGGFGGGSRKANLSTMTNYGMGYGQVQQQAGNGMFHVNRFYDPEVESPDRQYYPRDRLQANKYWRLFYEQDTLVGNAIDMYATMMVSDFDIIIQNDNSTEIKNILGDMLEGLQFVQKFKEMIVEYLVIGEAFPHLFFDNSAGIWSYMNLHNPDNMDVIDAPIVNMEPIINYVPDQNTIQLLNDSSKEAREIREMLPPEFLAKVRAGQKIRLKNVNCSYVARKLHSYDSRGTSILSRLWRPLLMEDAVYASTFATFRRAASPIRVIKMGNSASGWIPSVEEWQNLLSLVVSAEQDPQAWIATHYGVEYETWGNNDRSVTISKEYDTIEKIKLMALGLSKSFITGDSSFATAKSGLQVFLRRLLSLRQYFEATWIYPKLINPICEINGWSKSSPSEVAHNFRVKRGQEDASSSSMSIRPRIRWKNKLDPMVDSEMLQAYQQLNGLGFPISKDTIGTSVYLNWENELEKKAKEFKEQSEILTNVLGERGKNLYEQKEQQSKSPGAKPQGAPGSGAIPPGAKAPPKPMDDASKPPGSAPGSMPNSPESGGIETPSGGGVPEGI